MITGLSQRRGERALGRNLEPRPAALRTTALHTMRRIPICQRAVIFLSSLAVTAAIGCGNDDSGGGGKGAAPGTGGSSGATGKGGAGGTSSGGTSGTGGSNSGGASGAGGTTGKGGAGG